MTSLRWREAAEAAERPLLAAPVLESLLWRLESGEEGARADGRALALTCLEYQEADGSWQHSLLRTAEMLLLLRQLEPEPEHVLERGMRAAVEWLLRYQDAPGALSRTCTPRAHALQLCHHAVSGFFAPAPASVDLLALRLGSGQRLGADLDARLAASALALAAVRSWGATSRSLDLHLSGLVRLLQQPPQRDTISPAALTCVLRALLHLPASPAVEGAVNAGVTRLALSQRADGTWPGLDLYLSIDVLVDAGCAGALTTTARAALTRATHLLLPTVHERSAEARALRTAVRSMRYLAAPDAPVAGAANLVPASLP